ncbi:MAG: hypothetical protein HQM16_09550 [Deltaproteobacteria bacterium]|nr:hypothetical protein [Deltaproteobacteria bacterium]
MLLLTGITPHNAVQIGQDFRGKLAPSSVAAFDNTAPFIVDSVNPQAPALHEPCKLPRIITLPIDTYVHRRDRSELISPSIPAVDPVQRRALRAFGVMTVPGWGNFTFGARQLNFIQETTGHDVTHVSVSKDGAFTKRSHFNMIGRAEAALSPEWISELPTVIYRIWYAKRLQRHDHEIDKQVPIHNNIPERHIIMGHSKGGNLVYVLACLRQSYRDGTLNNFVARLKNEAGRQILKDIPFEVIEETAKGLCDDILGALGAPLYGIQGEFFRFAERHVLSVGFNRMTGNSAHFYTEDTMRRLHQMTGYKPNEVLDFVETTEVMNFNGIQDMVCSGAKYMIQLARSPLIDGANVMFRGLGKVIASKTRHDGVSPATYPDPFEHHIHIPGITHLDQVEKIEVMHRLFDELIKRGVLAR